MTELIEPANPTSTTIRSGDLIYSPREGAVYWVDADRFGVADLGDVARATLAARLRAEADALDGGAR